ncbi:MAG: hypothetical protein DRP42_04850 [Tenericutes bacterium]|nr:MAG: hypothetical protein DRP42_04850 [Mycoplasmatota bacterium]
MGNTTWNLGTEALKAYKAYVQSVGMANQKLTAANIEAFLFSPVVEPDDEAMAWQGRPWVGWQSDAM